MLTLHVYDPVDADADVFPPASALTISELLAQPPSWVEGDHDHSRAVV